MIAADPRAAAMTMMIGADAPAVAGVDRDAGSVTTKATPKLHGVAGKAVTDAFDRAGFIPGPAFFVPAFGLSKAGHRWASLGKAPGSSARAAG